MDKQIKKTIIDMENNQNTQISSSNGNTLNRIQLPNYDDEKNDNNKNRSNLTFKSNITVFKDNKSVTLKIGI